MNLLWTRKSWASYLGTGLGIISANVIAVKWNDKVDEFFAVIVFILYIKMKDF